MVWDTQRKVLDLFKKLAGDQLEGVTATAKQLFENGKSNNRAMADALEIHGRLANKKKSTTLPN